MLVTSCQLHALSVLHAIFVTDVVNVVIVTVLDSVAVLHFHNGCFVYCYNVMVSYCVSNILIHVVTRLYADIVLYVVTLLHVFIVLYVIPVLHVVNMLYAVTFYNFLIVLYILTVLYVLIVLYIVTVLHAPLC